MRARTAASPTATGSPPHRRRGQAIGATLAAATGVATFAALAGLPPGTAAGRPLVLIGATIGSGRFAIGFAAAFVVLGGALLLVRTRVRRAEAARADGPGEADAPAAGGHPASIAWYCIEPILWGAAAPLLSLLLDPWSFHGTVFVTGFAGVALGAIGARARMRQLDLRPRPSDRQAVVLLVALTVVIPTALAIPGPPWFHPLSGDEPHYLVTARSLWVDGDVNVDNDYEQRLTAPFWYGELSPHAKPGIDPAALYPIHGSGLSVWLAPWYGIGRGLSESWFNALVRFAMSLWLAAAAVALYYLIRDLAGRPAAFPGAALAVLTLPLLFAGPHLFPAVPVLALSCGAYVLLRRATVGRALLAGLMLAGLPWLHFKFFGLMAAVAGAGAWFIWQRNDRGRFRPLAALLVPLLVTGIGHIVFTWSLYGRISPLAIHVGADPTLRATAQGDNLAAYLADPVGAASTAIGYFLDQREGLLFYAPQYLLAAAGLAWLWRRRRADTVALMVALAALVGPYALAQETGHWAPPARPLTGVLWVLAGAMAIGLALPAGAGTAGRTRAALRALVVTWGGCATVLLLLQPDLLYHDYNVGRSLVLLRYGAPGLPLADLAPLWLGPDAVRWGVSLLGLGVALAIGIWFWRWGHQVSQTTLERPARVTATSLRAATTLVVVAAVLMLAHRALVPLSDLHQSWTYGPIRFWKPQSPPTRAWGEPEGLWTGGYDTVHLLLSSRRPIEMLTLEVASLAPMRADLQLGRDRQSFDLAPGERSFARLRPGPGAPWAGEHFYQLTVTARGGVAPIALGMDRDTRGLGVRLSVFQLEPAEDRASPASPDP